VTDIKKLILGITLVAIGLGLVLTANKIAPFIGGLLGLIGSYLVVKALLAGNIK
jgi:hypothetical protein